MPFPIDASKPSNHVVFAGDDGVARSMSVSMRSVWENASEQSALHFHVIHAMRPSSQLRIRRSLPRDARIDFVDGRDLIRSLPLNEGRVVDASRGYWLRTFAADLLPNVRRAAYLDSDILCLADIGELLAKSTGANPVGAVIDSYKTFSGANLQPERGTDEAYFNSGVLLCDFDAWRKQGVSRQVVELVTRADPPFAHLDQDALNIVFKNRWSNVCSGQNFEEWNDRTTSRLARQGGSNAEIQAQLETAKILHFVTPYKPWREQYPQNTQPFRLWQFYEAMTDFAHEPLERFTAVGWHDGRWQPTPKDEAQLAHVREVNRQSSGHRANTGSTGADIAL